MTGRWLKFFAAAWIAITCAVGGMWLRSQFRHDIWFIEKKHVAGRFWKTHQTQVHSISGRIVIAEVVERHQPVRPVPPGGGSGTLAQWMDDQLSWEEVPSAGVQWMTTDDLSLPATMKRHSQWSNNIGSDQTEHTRATVFYLMPMLALLAIPVAFGAVRLHRHRRRQRRLDRGLCPACGYDMRASNTMCPECGEIVGERPESTSLGGDGLTSTHCRSSSSPPS